LGDCVAVAEYRNAKTITVHDVSVSRTGYLLAVLIMMQVIWSLRRLGRPIYGFDPETYHPTTKKHKDSA
jgi:histone H4